MVRKVKTAQILVRLPKRIKNWIELQAKRNSSSQNSEIVRSIRRRMDAENADLTQGQH